MSKLSEFLTKVSGRNLSKRLDSTSVSETLRKIRCLPHVAEVEHDGDRYVVTYHEGWLSSYTYDQWDAAESAKEILDAVETVFILGE